MRPIAIYGLGEMGAGIARCLIRSGIPVHVFDPAVAQGWAKRGATVGASAAETAAGLQVHLVVVRQPDDVDRLLLGTDGVGRNAPPGSTIVVHTTTSPQHMRSLAEQLASSGGHTTLDAALSRRSGALEDGSLSLFVGASKTDYQTEHATLSRYSDNVVHVGGPGSGMALKLCNNWLLYANRLALIQAIGVAEHLGIDREVVLAALSSSTAGSWVIDHFSDVDRAILTRAGAPPAISARTHAELSLAMQMAEQLGSAPSSLTGALKRLFRI